MPEYLPNLTRPATPPAPAVGEWTLREVSELIDREAPKSWNFGSQHHDVIRIVLAALNRWGRPATPPAPAVGEVGELEAMLIQEAGSFEAHCSKTVNGECRTLACLQRGGYALRSGPPDPSVATCPELEKAGAMRRAADLLAQLSAAAPAVVPVAERLPEPHVKVLAHYFNGLGKGRTVCAIWVPAKSRSDDADFADEDFTEYDEETDKFYWPEGWYEAIENWEDLGWVKVDEGEVVYWQPLPKWPAHALPLPAPQGGEGEG